MQTAIVVFAFNRPDHLVKTLKYIAAAEGFDKLPLYVFIDGPRDNSEAHKVNEVNQLVAAFKHPMKKISVSNKNNGLRSSVINGLTKVFDHADAAIVLEDDICVHPEFLKYHLTCLNTFQERNDIWSISGYVIPEIGRLAKQICNEDLFLAPRASSWGWSTWKNRWEKAIWDKEVIFQHFKINEKAYNKTGGDKLRMLVNEFNGKSNSWAILWDYSHFMHSGFCVYPHNSFVKNIGLDNTGTHSKPSASYQVSLSESINIDSYSNKIKVNNEILKLFKRINFKWYRVLYDCFLYKRLIYKGIK